MSLQGITLRPERLLNKPLCQRLETMQYGVEYQPILHLDSGKIIGYEALARFWENNAPLAPSRVFNALHEDIDLFCALEQRIKTYQCANRPKEGELFVNIDPHILQNPTAAQEVFTTLKSQEGLVVELVENSYHWLGAKAVFDVFLKQDFTLAVDDFFQENSMLSLHSLMHCHVLKLDRNVICLLRESKAFETVVRGLIDFAHSTSKRVIIEGIETEADLSCAKALGCDGVQGFLFRPLFILRTQE